MRMFLVTAVLATGLVVSSCQSMKNFFGTDDPCLMAENAYSAFLIISVTTDVSVNAKRAASAGIAAIREQCSDGDIDNVTLLKLVNAYVRGLETYRSF